MTVTRTTRKTRGSWSCNIRHRWSPAKVKQGERAGRKSRWKMKARQRCRKNASGKKDKGRGEERGGEKRSQGEKKATWRVEPRQNRSWSSSWGSSSFLPCSFPACRSFPSKSSPLLSLHSPRPRPPAPCLLRRPLRLSRGQQYVCVCVRLCVCDSTTERQVQYQIHAE